MNHTATRKPTYSVNLDSTLRKTYLNDIFATDDCCANGVNLPLFKGNAPAVLGSGAVVKGYFIRYRDNKTVLLDGALSSNVATVELKKECYTQNGQFALVVKIMEGEVISTIFYGEGSVMLANTGSYVDPENIVPSLDELLARIADMEAATADGRAAAQEARDAGAEAVGIAQDAADEALAAAQTVKSIYELKADAILDESARAASHEVYAQRGPLLVTLYGKTTETGTGEKSPENPYAIRGVNAAQMRACGKNLFDIETWLKIPSTLQGNGLYKSDIPVLPAGKYVWTCSAYEQVDDLLYTMNLAVDNRRKVFPVLQGGVVKEQVVIDSVEPLYWELNYNPATFLSKIVNITAQIEEGSTATAYEPYCANTADLPLLPDDAPLHGNGTVDDTVENDVPSGCDKRIVLDGTYSIYKHSGYANVFYTAPNTALANSNIYCDQLPSRSLNEMLTSRGIAVDGYGAIMLNFGQYTTVDEVKAYLSANPLTIYYRSTEYTPDKDLRVCKVVRKYVTYQITGDTSKETWGFGNWGDVKRVYITGMPVSKSWDAIAGCNMYNVTPGESDANTGVRFHYQSLGQLNIIAPVDYWAALGVTDKESAAAYYASLYDAGTPLEVTYEVSNFETYMTDPMPLRKPDTLTTDTVTVTGNAETSVTYPHDTKHYIDSQIAAAVALALNN